MPSSNGGVDGDGEEDVDVVDAKGINTVFSFTFCNNFRLVDLDLDLEVLLPHKYALVHHWKSLCTVDHSHITSKVG